MGKIISILLVVLILLPVIGYSASKKMISDKELLKTAHRMVRLWWTTWITYGTVKAYRMLTLWRLECTRLMKKVGKS